MKLKFSIQIAGEKSLKEKFEAAIHDNPEIHMSFISSFIQIIDRILRLHERDNVTITNFKAEQIYDE